MPKNTCKHCKDTFTGWECGHCGKKQLGSCKECHFELVHGIIKNQNIHIIGGQGGLSGLDEDTDAYEPSWKADN